MLLENEKVSFSVRKAEATVFYFEVTEPSKITLESCSISEANDSKTETFVSVNDKGVCKENFHWKAPSSSKTVRFDFFPENPKNQLGTYRVSF